MHVFLTTVTNFEACRYQYQAEACEDDVNPQAQHVSAAIDAGNCIALQMDAVCGICFTSRTALFAAPVNTDCRMKQ